MRTHKDDFEKIPPDVRILALDQTWAWHLPVFGEDAEHIERIDTVVLVDLNCRTFICSATPTAFCVFLYHNVHLKPGVELSEDAWERIDSIVTAYADEDDYYDYATIEHHCETHALDRDRHHKVKVGADDIAAALEDDPEDPQRGLMERLREYYTCNHVV